MAGEVPHDLAARYGRGDAGADGCRDDDALTVTPRSLALQTREA